MFTMMMMIMLLFEIHCFRNNSESQQTEGVVLEHLYSSTSSQVESCCFTQRPKRAFLFMSKFEGITAVCYMHIFNMEDHS
jgi:hypothetical protein